MQNFIRIIFCYNKKLDQIDLSKEGLNEHITWIMKINFFLNISDCTNNKLPVLHNNM